MNTTVGVIETMDIDSFNRFIDDGRVNGRVNDDGRIPLTWNAVLVTTINAGVIGIF